MEITSIWSGLVAGIVIGLLGRVLAPARRRRIGCILTILIGVVGAAIGTAVGNAAGAGHLLTFVIQVVAATLLVMVFGVTVSGRTGRG